MNDVCAQLAANPQYLKMAATAAAFIIVGCTLAGIGYGYVLGHRHAEADERELDDPTAFWKAHGHTVVSNED